MSDGERRSIADRVRAALVEAGTAVQSAVDAALGEIARQQGGIAIPTGREAREEGITVGSARMRDLSDLREPLIALLDTCERRRDRVCDERCNGWFHSSTCQARMVAADRAIDTALAALRSAAMMDTPSGHETAVETAERTERIARHQVPLSTGERQFAASDRFEWCVTCGKHIGHHFGGDEYRCDPRIDGVPSRPADIDSEPGRSSRRTPATEPKIHQDPATPTQRPDDPSAVECLDATHYTQAAHR